MGHLYVLIGSSGVGKTTLATKAQGDGLADRVITCTTRAPRPHEVADVDYHFLSPAHFGEREHRGEFVETEAIHGHRYGVLVHDLSQALDAARPALISMGYGGAAAVKRRWPERVTIVGVLPPSVEHLRQRLVARGTDPAEVAVRLRTIDAESPTIRRLADRVIVNDELGQAYRELCLVLKREAV